MLYAQASGKQSIRDIQNGFAVHSSKMYHLGFSSSVKRSTLAEANKKRDWRVFERLFYNLSDRCKDITPKHKFKFKNPLYAFDATIINLCFESFPWAKFRAAKGALKLHCQLDYSGNLPCFVAATNGKYHDLTIARKFFTIIPDSIYCFDKGYMDFSWFRHINTNKAFFVTRSKKSLQYTVVGQQNALAGREILSDERITLSNFYAMKDYPDELRLIRYIDTETDKILEFLTNNFKLAAKAIAHIYKARWQIEVFFKWIKQNLKIKTFLGTSINAVLIQTHFLRLEAVFYPSS